MSCLCKGILAQFIQHLINKQAKLLTSLGILFNNGDNTCKMFLIVLKLSTSE